MILILTIQAVVRIRQSHERHVTSRSSSEETEDDGVLFPSVTRADADTDLLSAIQYLINYGFYKFGVEVQALIIHI